MSMSDLAGYQYYDLTQRHFPKIFRMQVFPRLIGDLDDFFLWLNATSMPLPANDWGDNEPQPI